MIEAVAMIVLALKLPVKGLSISRPSAETAARHAVKTQMR
jgi:hypothetical protein